jgi:hypothetical protein
MSLKNKTAVCAAVLAAVWMMAPAPASATLLVNGNFDDGGGSLAGWNTFGNAFSDVGISLSAPGSAKMFGNFSGGFNVTGIFQAFPATAGNPYTLDGASFISSGDPMVGVGAPANNWVVMKIAFFDAAVGGTELAAPGNEVTIADGTFAQDVWHDNPAVSVNAPAGTLRAEAFFLYLQPAFDGGAVFIDNAVFTPEPSSVALLALGGLAVLRRRR